EYSRIGWGYLLCLGERLPQRIASADDGGLRLTNAYFLAKGGVFLVQPLMQPFELVEALARLLFGPLAFGHIGIDAAKADGVPLLVQQWHATGLQMHGLAVFSQFRLWQGSERTLCRKYLESLVLSRIARFRREKFIEVNLPDQLVREVPQDLLHR